MSVWKRLQRVGKKAAQFTFAISFQELSLECKSGFVPSRLVVVCLRRKRKFATTEHIPTSSPQRPEEYKFIWPVPEDVELKSTFYFSSSSHNNSGAGGGGGGASNKSNQQPLSDAPTRFEDKEWTIQIEDLGDKGHRRRVLAFRAINFAEYIDLQDIIHQRLNLSLKGASKKVIAANISLTLTSTLLKTGASTDSDMISLSSIMSEDISSSHACGPSGSRNSEERSKTSLDTSDQIMEIQNLTSDINTLTMALVDNDSPKQMRGSNTHLSPPPSSSAIATKTNGSASSGALPKSPTAPEVKDNSSNEINKSGASVAATKSHSSSSERHLEKSPSTKKKLLRHISPAIRQSFRKSVKKSSSSAAAVGGGGAAAAASGNGSALASDVSAKTINVTVSTSETIVELQEKQETSTKTITPGVSDITGGGGGGAASLGDSVAKSSSPSSTTIVAVKSSVNEDNNGYHGGAMKATNPSDQLLTWCQRVTQGYRDVNITNMTTSFRSGMAFCAIIHHFHPELINFDSLRPQDVEANNRLAFDSASKLGVPPLLNAADMVFLKVPDRLMVMTYLHKLRSHFEKNSEKKSPSHESTESNGQRSRHESGGGEKVSSNVNNSQSSKKTIPASTSAATANNTALPNKSMTQSVHEPSSFSKIANVSPSGDGVSSTNTVNVNNKTSSQTSAKGGISFLHQPFGRLSMKTSSKSSRLMSFNADGSVKSDNKRASESTTSSQATDHHVRNNPFNSTEPNVFPKFDSPAAGGAAGPTLAVSTSRPNPGTTTGSPFTRANQNQNGYRYSLREKNDWDPAKTAAKFDLSTKEENNCDKNMEKNNSVVVEEEIEDDNYVSFERKELTRQEELLDEKAEALETELRLAMHDNNDPQREEILLQAWFRLVNQKDRLMHRRLELDIIEQERNLEQRFKLLNEELRTSMSIDDSKKTSAQRNQENRLLKELLIIVNERDKIIQQIDQQERADDEDESIAQATQSASLNALSLDGRRYSADSNCRIH